MKFEIHNLGPIRDAEFELNDLTVLTGYQASGKSSIAKVVYFFRTIKDEIAGYICNGKIDQNFKAESESHSVISFIELASKHIISQKFSNIFGSISNLNNGMCILCHYDDKKYIKVSSECDKNSINDISDILNVDIESSLIDGLNEIIKMPTEGRALDKVKAAVNSLFADSYRSVYIPAGRNVITFLGDQFVSFYGSLDDRARRGIDGATLDFINTIIKVRAQFSSGLEGVERSYFEYAIDLSDKERTKRAEVFSKAVSLSYKILSGRYISSSGEERLMLSDNDYIKLNFASSGQQEVVWIINLLFYYLFEEKVSFIIEEPESHLFPATQKLLMEYISLIFHQDDQVFITTHSPYILGTINNMLYAGNLSKRFVNRKNEIDDIIPSDYQLNIDNVSAWFVEAGRLTDIMDHDINEIDHDKVDEKR